MSRHWQRRHEFLTFDLPTIAAMLHPIVPPARVEHAQPLTEGFINTNYKVTVSGFDTPLVLRVYARDRAACRKEAEITRLIQHRVAMPEILYTDTDGDAFGWPYTVMRWIEGIPLNIVLSQPAQYDADPSGDVVAIASALGQTLAAISSYTFPHPGFFGPDLSIAQPLGSAAESCAAFISQCLFDGHTGQRLGPDLTERVWSLVTANASLLSTANAVTSLVHADFKDANLLLRQQRGVWRVAAVLDWEFAHAGTSLFDIGILLRDARKLPPGFEPAFAAAFTANGGYLPPNWKPITRLLDLMNLCEFLNTPTVRGALVDDVTALIRATVDEWPPRPH